MDQINLQLSQYSQQIKRKANASNNAATTIGAAALAGGAIGANKIAKNPAVKNAGNNIAAKISEAAAKIKPQEGSNLDKAVKTATKKASEISAKITAKADKLGVTSAAKSIAEKARTGSAKLNNAGQKVAKYIKGMNPKVKAATTILGVLLAANHVKRSGQIDGAYKALDIMSK